MPPRCPLRRDLESTEQGTHLSDFRTTDRPRSGGAPQAPRIALTLHASAVGRARRDIGRRLALSGGPVEPRWAGVTGRDVGRRDDACGAEFGRRGRCRASGVQPGRELPGVKGPLRRWLRPSSVGATIDALGLRGRPTSRPAVGRTSSVPPAKLGQSLRRFAPLTPSRWSAGRSAGPERAGGRPTALIGRLTCLRWPAFALRPCPQLRTGGRQGRAAPEGNLDARRPTARLVPGRRGSASFARARPPRRRSAARARHPAAQLCR